MTASWAPGQAPLVCPECSTQVAPALLACPSCHRLVHAAELERLASQAQRAQQARDSTTALAAWRQVLDLLPPDTAQHQTVAIRVAELSRAVDNEPVTARKGTGWTKVATGLGIIGVLLLKFKFVLIFVATKAKLLLLGLTKASTLFSMLLSAGVYWTVWGWKFAFGVVLSIYVHEMGHVHALQRFGIKATAPMFIPGIGAVVRLKQYPANRHEDARVGLAGPIWGVAATVAAYVIYLATRVGVWGAIAHFGAWVNLFNLLPVWQLDGARGFRALTRTQRWIAVAVIGVMWLITAEGLLALLFVAGALAAWFGDAADQPDNTALLQYAGLVAILSLMTEISVPTSGGGRAGPAHRQVNEQAGLDWDGPQSMFAIRPVTRASMPYIIAEPCINVKDRSCVDVCPVDCIYEGEDQLYIHPDECIDCGACEPECPVTAIFPEEDTPPQWKSYIAKNRDVFQSANPPGKPQRKGS